jgi:hypothetical protein
MTAFSNIPVSELTTFGILLATMVIRPPTTPTWPHLLSHQNPLAAATTGDNGELTELGWRIPRVVS